MSNKGKSRRDYIYEQRRLQYLEKMSRKRSSTPPREVERRQSSPRMSSDPDSPPRESLFGNPQNEPSTFSHELKESKEDRHSQSNFYDRSNNISNKQRLVVRGPPSPESNFYERDRIPERKFEQKEDRYDYSQEKSDRSYSPPPRVVQRPITPPMNNMNRKKEREESGFMMGGYEDRRKKKEYFNHDIPQVNAVKVDRRIDSFENSRNGLFSNMGQDKKTRERAKIDHNVPPGPDYSRSKKRDVVSASDGGGRNGLFSSFGKGRKKEKFDHQIPPAVDNFVKRRDLNSAGGTGLFSKMGRNNPQRKYIENKKRNRRMNEPSVDEKRLYREELEEQMRRNKSKRMESRQRRINPRHIPKDDGFDDPLPQREPRRRSEGYDDDRDHRGGRRRGSGSPPNVRPRVSEARFRPTPSRERRLRMEDRDVDDERRMYPGRGRRERLRRDPYEPDREEEFRRRESFERRRSRRDYEDEMPQRRRRDYYEEERRPPKREEYRERRFEDRDVVEEKYPPSPSEWDRPVGRGRSVPIPSQPQRDFSHRRPGEDPREIKEKRSKNLSYGEELKLQMQEREERKKREKRERAEWEMKKDEEDRKYFEMLQEREKKQRPSMKQRGIITGVKSKPPPGRKVFSPVRQNPVQPNRPSPPRENDGQLAPRGSFKYSEPTILQEKKDRMEKQKQLQEILKQQVAEREARKKKEERERKEQEIKDEEERIAYNQVLERRKQAEDNKLKNKHEPRNDLQESGGGGGGDGGGFSSRPPKANIHQQKASRVNTVPQNAFSRLVDDSPAPPNREDLFGTGPTHPSMVQNPPMMNPPMMNPPMMNHQVPSRQPAMGPSVYQSLSQHPNAPGGNNFNIRNFFEHFRDELKQLTEREFVKALKEEQVKLKNELQTTINETVREQNQIVNEQRDRLQHLNKLLEKQLLEKHEEDFRKERMQNERRVRWKDEEEDEYSEPVVKKKAKKSRGGGKRRNIKRKKVNRRIEYNDEEEGLDLDRGSKSVKSKSKFVGRNEDLFGEEDNDEEFKTHDAPITPRRRRRNDDVVDDESTIADSNIGYDEEDNLSTVTGTTFAGDDEEDEKKSLTGGSKFLYPTMKSAKRVVESVRPPSSSSTVITTTTIPDYPLESVTSRRKKKRNKRRRREKKKRNVFVDDNTSTVITDTESTVSILELGRKTKDRMSHLDHILTQDEKDMKNEMIRSYIEQIPQYSPNVEREPRTNKIEFHDNEDDDRDNDDQESTIGGESIIDDNVSELGLEQPKKDIFLERRRKKKKKKKRELLVEQSLPSESRFITASKNVFFSEDV